MTTKPKTDLPTHVYIESALRPSTLLCEQISTVSEERIGEWIGELTESEVQGLYMPEKSAKIAVRSARKCEKLLDRKHAGNKNADACDK